MDTGFPAEAAPEPLISLSGLRRRFIVGGQPVDALDGVDLAVHAGEFVAVMGSSGSGKSTLLNLVGCLDVPTSGDYRLDGENVVAVSNRRRARMRNRRFGFIFQEFNLFRRLNAFENVELPLLYRGADRRTRRKSTEAALEAVGLADRSHHRPTQLSGGEQQRVAVARALVGRPDIILADEPTGALDSVTGDRVVRILKGLNDLGLTILLVTHDGEIARHAERLVRMRDGRIVSDEPAVSSRAAAPGRAAVRASAP